MNLFEPFSQSNKYPKKLNKIINNINKEKYAL